MFGNFVSTFFCCAILCLIGLPANAQVRSYDGSNNNLSNPLWGSAGSEFIRTTFADYGDGVSAPAGATSANPRDISNAIGSQTGQTPSSRGLSSFVWQWGQFIDHDIALTPGTTTESHHISVTDPGDALFPLIPMSRSAYASGTTGQRQQVNANSSFLDGSMVYGASAARAAALRTFSGGLMQTSAGNLLPYNTSLLDNANDTGIEADAALFLAGDRRANEQPGLISMHTLFVREHNRIAADLATNNPTWTDEQIYQHSRRLVGGQIQSITYKEFLPALMGSNAPAITAYDSTVDATLSNEFATAAFRFGHTQVTDSLMRMDGNGQTASGGDLPMMDGFFSPSLINSSAEIDYYLNGLRYQTQNETDTQVVDDLRSMLFGPAGAGGLDLMAVNIQRGRDHGLATYSDTAILFGLVAPTSFSDLTSDITLQNRLASAYSSVDEVDLWTGLLAEDRVLGTEFGQLLNLMMHDEFTRLMEGDRFFFMWDQSLSAQEIDTLMNTRLHDIVERNTGLTNLDGANLFLAVPEPSALGVLGLLTVGLAVRRRRV